MSSTYTKTIQTQSIKCYECSAEITVNFICALCNIHEDRIIELEGKVENLERDNIELKKDIIELKKDNIELKGKVENLESERDLIQNRAIIRDVILLFEYNYKLDLISKLPVTSEISINYNKRNNYRKQIYIRNILLNDLIDEFKDNRKYAYAYLNGVDFGLYNDIKNTFKEFNSVAHPLENTNLNYEDIIKIMNESNFDTDIIKDAKEMFEKTGFKTQFDNRIRK